MLKKLLLKTHFKRKKKVGTSVIQNDLLSEILAAVGVIGNFLVGVILLVSVYRNWKEPQSPISILHLEA